MKFDLVRVWKDEAYRQSLSGEQLPANPAGELAEAQLDVVYGGCCGANTSLFTFAVECENETFSLNFNTGESLFEIPTNVCINNE